MGDGLSDELIAGSVAGVVLGLHRMMASSLRTREGSELAESLQASLAMAEAYLEMVGPPADPEIAFGVVFSIELGLSVADRRGRRAVYLGCLERLTTFLESEADDVGFYLAALHQFVSGDRGLSRWLERVGPTCKQAGAKVMELPRRVPTPAVIVPMSELSTTGSPTFVRQVAESLAEVLVERGEQISRLQPTPEDRRTQVRRAKAFRPRDPMLGKPFQPALPIPARESAWEKPGGSPGPSALSREKACVQGLVFAALAILIGVVARDVIQFARPIPIETAKEGVSMASRDPEGVARTFVYGNELEKRLQVLRDPRHAPLAREFFAQNPGDVASLRALGRRMVQGMSYHCFHVAYASGEDRWLPLVDDRTGVYVDWASFARLGSAGWEEVVSGRVESAEMRVFAELSEYYNRSFSDQDRYVSVALTTPDQPGTFYAYAERESEVGRSLLVAFHRSPEVRPRMLLRMSRAKDFVTEEPMFQVERLVALGWVRNLSEDYQASLVRRGLPISHEIPQISRRRAIYGDFNQVDRNPLPPLTL